MVSGNFSSLVFLISDFSIKHNLSQIVGVVRGGERGGETHTCQLNVKPPFHLAPMLCVGAEIYEALPQFIRRRGGASQYAFPAGGWKRDREGF